MERIMVANLKKVYEKPRTKRRRVVADVLRKIAAKNAKGEYFNVRIDNSVMKEIYKNGGKSPLKKIKVKLTKDDKTGLILVTLAEPPIKKPKEKKETKKVKETKNENIEKKSTESKK